MFLCNGKTLFAEAQVAISEPQLEKFETFAQMLIEKNRVMNLTAITEADEVTVKHFIDSLTCYDETFFAAGASVLDLGTGAGFPGIPLAIMHDDLKITFFDSLQKRLNFLRDVTTAIGYKNASFLHGRAYVKIGGTFIALKGAAYEEELKNAVNALKILGAEVESVQMKSLPGLTDIRAVIYIKKVKESPFEYPRKPKVAAKNPL